MGVDELSNALWQERELLETLLFKLEEEELVIAQGRTRWLARAAREVELVLERMREAEVGRAIDAQGVARELGLADGASLLEIAAAAPEPWSEMLRGHHLALSAVTAEIATLSHSNHELLQQTLQATREALLGLEATASEYDTKGGTRTAPNGSFMLDQDI